MLFRIDAANKMGLSSSTSIPCQWIIPTETKTLPVRIKELSIKKSRLGVRKYRLIESMILLYRDRKSHPRIKDLQSMTRLDVKIGDSGQTFGGALQSCLRMGNYVDIYVRGERILSPFGTILDIDLL